MVSEHKVSIEAVVKYDIFWEDEDYLKPPSLKSIVRSERKFLRDDLNIGTERTNVRIGLLEGKAKK
jgi:hypothetical protein